MKNLIPLKNQFKLEINRLKNILIILTIVEIGYFILSFTHEKLIYQMYSNSLDLWIIGLTHYSFTGYLIWYNWKKLPLGKKKKVSNTLMIFLLGIIGMWLWLPNQKEIDDLSNHQ
ncbi:hypothetical protein KFE94_08740 [bacterium SCSIO 12643]|nr:hypothetical protein KFE94_08740 [bacterium SCSIO 12643]